MESRTLEELNEAKENKRAVVLFTRFSDGQQYLYYPDKTTQEAALTEEMLQLAKDALRSDRSQSVELSDGEWFLQVINPPLRMIIVGAVHIAQVLVPMACMAGYEVNVVDPRRAFASDARFPDVGVVTDWPDVAMQNLAPDARTAIVTLTHDPKLDDPALQVALTSPAFYIGSLGSKKTQQGRYERLVELGFSEEQQARIHGPIGLNIGAKSPAEIAISIMAEITESLRKIKE